jgi:two-component system sporulation sensor kinase C
VPSPDANNPAHTEQALRLSEQKFRLLVQNIPEAVALINAQGKFLFINHQGANALGKNAQDIVGKSIQDFFPKNAADQHLRKIRNVIQSGKPYTSESKTKLHGKWEWFGVNVQPYRDANENITAALVITTIITKQKHTEQELNKYRQRLEQLLEKRPTQLKTTNKKLRQEIKAHKQTEQSLRQSEEEYRSVVDHINDGVYRLNRQGYFTFVNKTVEIATGIPANKLLTMHFLDVIPPEHRKHAQENFQKLLQGKSIPPREVECYTEHRGAFTIEVNTFPLIEDGKVMGSQGIARDITEHKQREKTLQEHQILLQTLLEASMDPALLVRVDGTIIALNQAAATALRGRRNDLVGTQITHYHPGTVADYRKAKGMEVVRSRKPVRFEDQRGGRWIDQTIYPVFDHNGEVTKLAVFARDITDLKKTEQSLRESEEKFRNLAEQSPHMIFINKKGRIIYANQVSAEITGYSHQELYDPDFDFHKLVSPDSVKTINNAFASHQKGTEVKSYELTLITKHGKKLNTIHATKLIPYGGENAILGIITDITERKQMENALKESEAKFREIANNIPGIVFQIVFEKDGSFSFPYISDNVKMYVPCEPQQIQNNPKLPFDFILKEDLDHIKKLTAESASQMISNVTECRIRTKTGDIKWLRISTTPHILPDGRMLRNGVAYDVTERKQAEKQMHRYSQQLEKEVKTRTLRIQELEHQRAESEKLAATGRMAARVAHEINNPLAGIKNSFLLVKDAIPENHPYYDYLERIDREVERIAGVVRRMFDLYRPDQEFPRKLTINDIIRDVVELLGTLCRKRNVKISMDMPQKPVIASLPAGYFTQVLFNIIQNAVEASPDNSTVTVKTAKSKNTLHISVSDQGCGIPDELKTHVFEPFFTTKKDHTTAGLGLGLSVSKGMVESMGGSLDFNSTPNQGTEFQISIPLNKGGKEA